MNIDYFMNEAIKEAEKAYKSDEVPIGGLLVNNSTQSIITRNFNRMNISKNAINHCELLIIFDACKNLKSKYLQNTSLFITLEPCTMCAAAICEAQINTVYFGAYDDKRGGLENLSINYKNNKFFSPEVYGGIMQKQCSQLLKNFFQSKRK